MSRLSLFALAASITTLAGGHAFAHAHLLSSSPAANAATAAPKVIVLHFSEAPMPKFSGVLVMTSAGAAVLTKPMPISDGKTISLTPKTALKAGAYTVKWHAVTADTHRTEGAFVFTVK